MSGVRPSAHLVVLLDAREGCSHLRVAAPVVGIADNGHHVKVVQRPDERGQSDGSVLPTLTVTSLSRCNPPQPPRPQPHLIPLWSKHLDGLSSHEPVAMNLQTARQQQVFTECDRCRWGCGGVGVRNSIIFSNVLVITSGCFSQNNAEIPPPDVKG